MSKLAMIVKTKTQPNQRVEALHLFEKHLAQRAQASRDAFQANGQAGFQEGWFLAYMQEVQPLLAGEPTVIMATPQWAKGIQL
jgi:hypothetical protein